jgi:hypothetical protein
MTKRALVALWVGIIIIIFMGLFPPWEFPRGLSSGRGSAGPVYDYITTQTGGGMVASFIMLPLLVVQWVIVASIIAGVVATLNRRS